MGHKRWLIPVLLGLATLPATAQDRILLGLPIDCTLGMDCFIQQYVDHDPGPDARDFACSSLTYDGHKGTDFGLISERLMQRGVPVIASAPGVVKGWRDGMRDVTYSADVMDEVDGRDCGNGVLVDHENGWTTQYCHMRQDSVLVKKGDRVERGTELGLVGLSGRTQFPHVEITVRRKGEVVDPFTPNTPDICNANPTETLWIDPPEYRPGGILSVGISDEVPTFNQVKAGTARDAMLTITSPGLIVWGYVFGGRKGDVTRITLTGPNGEIVNYEDALEKNKAQFFRAAGKRLKAPSWPAGVYTAGFNLIRDGQVIDSGTTFLELR